MQLFYLIKTEIDEKVSLEKFNLRSTKGPNTFYSPPLGESILNLTQFSCNSNYLHLHD